MKVRGIFGAVSMTTSREIHYAGCDGPVKQNMAEHRFIDLTQSLAER